MVAWTFHDKCNAFVSRSLALQTEHFTGLFGSAEVPPWHSACSCPNYSCPAHFKCQFHTSLSATLLNEVMGFALKGESEKDRTCWQNYRATPGYPGKTPRISREQVWFSWVSRDIPNSFLEGVMLQDPLGVRPISGTEKVPQRNSATKILPNFQVNLLVRFASKSLFYQSVPWNNYSEHSLVLFVRPFGFVAPFRPLILLRPSSTRAELKDLSLLLRWRSPICGFLQFSAKIFGFLLFPAHL